MPVAINAYWSQLIVAEEAEGLKALTCMLKPLFDINACVTFIETVRPLTGLHLLVRR